MNYLAKMISHLFNPAMIALGAFIYLGWRAGDWLAGGIGIVIYALVPGAIWTYLYNSGIITELYPAERNERQSLLLLGGGCYAFGCIVLWMVDATPLALGAGLAFCGNTLLVWQINKYWKISIHAVGVSGAWVIFLLSEGLDMWPLGFALLLVAWARLHLGVHTPTQVVAGTGLGAGISALLVCPFAQVECWSIEVILSSYNI